MRIGHAGMLAISMDIAYVCPVVLATVVEKTLFSPLDFLGTLTKKITDYKHTIYLWIHFYPIHLYVCLSASTTLS
jgi:hypothetical protein